jgi:poly-gamma-glutamate synthesis protein (capsule biosynthesis protein)
VWGDALAELDRVSPDARIVNLETAVTASEEVWMGKGVHYRMHPANAPCLSAAKIDCCVLANNHALDWGRSGLRETLSTLYAIGICTAGAGIDAGEAAMPAVIGTAGGSRVLVFAYGMTSSGVFPAWRAGKQRAGVNMLSDLSDRAVEAIARAVALHKRTGDIVVASIHWGGNWGFNVTAEERRFARGLLDSAGVDIVHGHSSHHVKGIEVYAGKLILYGCGDLLNDYEGIGGHAEYRGDLALLYFPTLDTQSGRMVRCSLVPTRTQHLRVNRARPDDLQWLLETLNRESRKLGAVVERQPDGLLKLGPA